MIKIIIALLIVGIFCFLIGFILGYMFLRTKSFFGGFLITENKEIKYAQLKDTKIIEEGNFVTFKIIEG